jgi:hypothetical protein
MVFRGWYDFGGGSMADMGHYSLWTVFNALELGAPVSVEPMMSHVCAIDGNGVSTKIRNDFSFPMASSVRFRYPAKGERPAIDLVWWEGGMHPPVPQGLDRDLPAEGMMFAGDKGTILAGFRVENPWLLPGRPPAEAPRGRRQREAGELSKGLQQWVAACRGGTQSDGNFANAWPISEAVNLYAVALRTGKKLLYDAQSMSITNVPEANKYLARDYRKGWNPV